MNEYKKNINDVINKALDLKGQFLGHDNDALADKYYSLKDYDGHFEKVPFDKLGILENAVEGLLESDHTNDTLYAMKHNDEEQYCEDALKLIEISKNTKSEKDV